MCRYRPDTSFTYLNDYMLYSFWHRGDAEATASLEHAWINPEELVMKAAKHALDRIDSRRSS